MSALESLADEDAVHAALEDGRVISITGEGRIEVTPRVPSLDSPGYSFRIPTPDEAVLAGLNIKHHEAHKIEMPKPTAGT